MSYEDIQFTAANVIENVDTLKEKLESASTLCALLEENMQTLADDADSAAEKLEAFTDLNLEPYQIEEELEELNEYRSTCLTPYDIEELIEQVDELKDKIEEVETAEGSAELKEQNQLLAQQLEFAVSEIKALREQNTRFKAGLDEVKMVSTVALWDEEQREQETLLVVSATSTTSLSTGS